jgi:glycosyltransferase XagB
MDRTTHALAEGLDANLPRAYAQPWPAVARTRFYLLVAWELWTGEFLASSGAILDQGFLLLAGFNMIAGYVSAMALAAVATMRSGRRALSPYVLLMPVYWLLISYAAWRAMVQLAVAPHFWEKTEHAARRKISDRPSTPRVRR